MSERPNSWHRDSLPWWGWIAMGVLRAWAVVVAVLPIAVFLLAGWVWLHWRDPEVVAAVKFVRGLLDGLLATLERATR
ncbi:MAG: hypothetical protein HZA61_04050 [Candidatus Eisenbacteria bacterium]|uniref:Uncharacterized protein n=1 Tax=Eiseniibacteriota bacterium TaxID=2212470 RepID=A0A933W7N6_UNCEI|nr:hypothetical protein [Candidatus Eisenbacteria bacterium]